MIKFCGETCGNKTEFSAIELTKMYSKLSELGVCYV